MHSNSESSRPISHFSMPLNRWFPVCSGFNSSFFFSSFCTTHFILYFGFLSIVCNFRFVFHFEYNFDDGWLAYVMVNVNFMNSVIWVFCHCFQLNAKYLTNTMENINCWCWILNKWKVFLWSIWCSCICIGHIVGIQTRNINHHVNYFIKITKIAIRILRQLRWKYPFLDGNWVKSKWMRCHCLLIAKFSTELRLYSEYFVNKGKCFHNKKCFFSRSRFQFWIAFNLTSNYFASNASRLQSI